MKLVILGATGTVGRGVLLEALDDPAVTQILTLGRSKSGELHPKLRELVHDNLFDPAPIQNQLRGYDACAFCAGVSSVGMSEAGYTRLTYDMTLAVAKTFLAANPGGAFAYVSGQGTDSTERGAMMWARVKGRTENALMAMPFRAATMFRPGAIQPERGIRPRQRLYRVFYAFARPFSGLIIRIGAGTTTTLLARAILEALERPPQKRILENNDINALAAQRRRSR